MRTKKTFLLPTFSSLYFLEPFRIPKLSLKKHSILKPVSAAAEVMKTVPKSSKENFANTLLFQDVSYDTIFKKSNCQQIGAKSCLETSPKNYASDPKELSNSSIAQPSCQYPVCKEWPSAWVLSLGTQART